MNKRYTLGKLSKGLGISKDTLKFYAEEGIFQPDFIDENGYRYYTNPQLLELDFIILLRHLSIPIAEIKQILNRDDIKYTLSVIQNQRAMVEEQTKNMQQKMLDIDWYLKEYAKENTLYGNISIELKEYDKKAILLLYGPQEDDLIQYKLQQEYYQYLPDEQWIRRKHGAILNLKAIKNNPWEIDATCISIDAGFVSFSNVKILEKLDKQYIDYLPAGQYIVMRFRIVNNRINFKPLFDFAKERNLKIMLIIMDDNIPNMISKSEWITTIKAYINE